MSQTLISPESIWILWAIMLTLAAFGLWAERTRWGARLSGAVVSILGAFVLANLSVIPSAAPAYDIVWGYLVPLAIPLLLLQANLRKIIREAGPTLVAFGCGAVGTVLGTVIGFYLVPLGPEGWKLAAIFCSTYVGGSLNYVAAAQSVQLQSGDLLSAGVAADNLAMTLYFLVLFALPSVAFLKKHFRTHHEEQAGKLTDSNLQTSTDEAAAIRTLDLAKGLAVAAIICAVGFSLETIIGIRGSGILIITALIVLLATTCHRQLANIAGADTVGTFFMQIFFVVIGASANIATVLRAGTLLFVFAGVILTVHLVFILTAGWLLKLDLAEIVIASNANMGGPTTAAAMASARRWQALVIPAILCGTLGYAVATFIGVAVGVSLR